MHFVLFYNPVTYLEAIMHKNVVGFKMGIVIYNEVSNMNTYANKYRYITFEKHLYKYLTVTETFFLCRSDQK